MPGADLGAGGEKRGARSAREGTRPRGILFDWDGTLVDSWAAIHAALRETFIAMGAKPWTVAETRRRVRNSLRDSFPGLFGERWEEAAEIFYRRYGALHLAHTSPLPGAAEMLEALAGLGIFLGVISNKDGSYLRREVQHLGWDRYFARLVGATDAPEDKPSPVAVRHALAGSGIAPGPEVWLVGDAAIDLECARSAGCVGVLIGRADETAVSALWPARRFRNCADFAAFFRRF